MHKKAIKYIDKNFKGNAEGKTIIITGGNSGIGFISAKYCLYLKMRVIIACRNESRGQKAIDTLKEEFPDGNISLMLLDVSEEQSIINFVNAIKEKNINIDYFYHNAGVFHLPYQLKEGRELTISTNFFGPFFLTELLLPYFKSLKHDVVMIFTSSIAAKFSKNKVEMVVPQEKSADLARYNDSKMLDAHLFKYLSEHDSGNIKYFMVHPGMTATGLFTNSWKNKIFAKIAVAFVIVFGNPVWKSSLSLIKVLSNDAIPNSFYGPSHIFHTRGYPKIERFLDKKYSITNEVIEKAEIITSRKLLK